jgi:hypothetical protein
MLVQRMKAHEAEMARAESFSLAIKNAINRRQKLLHYFRTPIHGIWVHKRSTYVYICTCVLLQYIANYFILQIG